MRRSISLKFRQSVSRKNNFFFGEIDKMMDLLYEKQGSYLQGKKDQSIEVARIMINAGKRTIDEAVSLLHVSKSDILSSEK